MPQFAPDLVAFGDIAGYGQLDVGHGREHTQFVALLAAQSPTIEIPDHEFINFFTLPAGPAQQLAEIHHSIHQLLRSATGVAGVDLTAFGPHNRQDFDQLLNYHRQEHAQIRAVLGIT